MLYTERGSCSVNYYQLTDKIDYKLEKRNLINEHELNREPVPLIVEYW